MVTRAFWHEAYTVGWVCALKCEFEAARLLLDEEHKSLAQPRGDDNIYLLGRMKGHNIVIACVGMGTSAAAHAAANLLRTFPNIRFGLTVGIGGGAPLAPDTSDPRKDIRLGDVVVSTAKDSHGGVVQYDKGKMMHDGTFAIASHLNKPPTILSQAVVRLQSNHVLGKGKMTRYINKIGKLANQQDNLSDYRFPGRDRDFLFKPDYPHAGGRDCSTCDVGQLHARLDRKSNDPVVHYGLIGSSNTVMKSARCRDTLRSDWNVLCFETEAAGLMDNFPCVVIRGISNYSDDHKNDDWRPYAAVVAAEYAKDLLRVIEPEQVDNIDTVVIEVTRRFVRYWRQRKSRAIGLLWIITHGRTMEKSSEVKRKKCGSTVPLAISWLRTHSHSTNST
ncbi:nucleoside phosphorylase domain-containing protein [Aspergillus lucknowensis]|uniref:Nucleoside phosphorylase domain-containing protein n=1 Tax=Aspergillus lucknowensis TaxID=176173 RepID=A0ABR4LQX7_9EURO